MLSYSEIAPGRYIVLDNQPYEVLSAQTVKKSRQKASNQVKLKNLVSGKVVERSFHQSDNVEEADIAKKTVVYLYSHRTQHWFCEEGNPKARFDLPDELIGPYTKFLKQNTPVEALRFGDNIVGIRPPIKMDLRVDETPPGVRGNTAQGGTKQATLETGAVVNVPLFIEAGDIIRVNTETGAYVERVSKSQ